MYNIYIYIGNYIVSVNIDNNKIILTRHIQSTTVYIYMLYSVYLLCIFQNREKKHILDIIADSNGIVF